MAIVLSWTPKAGPGQLLGFDATLSEAHELSSRVTEHPVEKGANITDFVQKNLEKLVIEIFVSMTPIETINEEDGGFIGPKSIKVATYSRPLIFLPGALITAGVDALKSLFASAPPDKAIVFQHEAKYNPVINTYKKLKTLVETAQLIEVFTPVRAYTDLILENVATSRTPDVGTGAKFTLSFRQLRVVESKRVSAPTTAEVRGVSPVKKGAAGPKEETGPKKSIAAAAQDASRAKTP